MASKAVALLNAEVLPPVDIVTKVVNTAATTHIVFGTVVDALCKSGVAAARVELRGIKADGTSIAKQVTTADMVFEITGLVGDVLYSACFKPNWRQVWSVHEGVSAVAAADKAEADPLLFALAPAVPAGKVTLCCSGGGGRRHWTGNTNRTKATRLRKGDLDLMVGFDAVKVKNCKNCYPGTSGPCKQYTGMLEFPSGHDNTCPVGTHNGASRKQTTCVGSLTASPSVGKRTAASSCAVILRRCALARCRFPEAFKGGVRPAPIPEPAQQKCGAVHQMRSRMAWKW